MFQGPYHLKVYNLDYNSHISYFQVIYQKLNLWTLKIGWKKSYTSFYVTTYAMYVSNVYTLYIWQWMPNIWCMFQVPMTQTYHRRCAYMQCIYNTYLPYLYNKGVNIIQITFNLGFSVSFLMPDVKLSWNKNISFRVLT